MSNVVGDSNDLGVAAVQGTHTSGFGVAGESDTALGVIGISKTGRGVEGRSSGVFGVDHGSAGVFGECKANIGVKGLAVTGVGVSGVSTSGFGVAGESDTAFGVIGISKTGRGVEGRSSGVFGVDPGSAGVFGECKANIGVKGLAVTGTGVNGVSTSGFGVAGESDTGLGVIGLSKTGIAIFGKGGGLAGRFEGDVEVTGDIRLANADCAEDFDVSGPEPIEPGTVMVLGNEGELHQSDRPYDKHVAGVISGAGGYKPGIRLDKHQSQQNRQPLALLGKVYCKVDAQYSPIQVGDLLTTSATPGHAMKAGEPHQAFGAVIGKALRPLNEGQGLIPILIALQ